MGVMRMCWRAGSKPEPAVRPQGCAKQLAGQVGLGTAGGTSVPPPAKHPRAARTGIAAARVDASKP